MSKNEEHKFKEYIMFLFGTWAWPIKTHVESRNGKSKFQWKYKNSTSTNKNKVIWNKWGKKQARMEKTEWSGSLNGRTAASLLWNTHHLAYSSIMDMQAADYFERQPLAMWCHHPKTGSALL